jgi:hypothetical protein
MAVPAHDERDFEFAKKYGLPIRQVIAVEGRQGGFLARRLAGVVCRQAARPLREFRQVRRLGLRRRVDAIAADLSAKGLGDTQVQYRLRDWGVSRQRYWGCPIPLIHCDAAAPCRCPTTSCRWCCPKTACPTAPAIRWQARRLRRLRLPEMRQAGPARNRHHGHLRRFVLVLRALLRRSGDARGELGHGRCRQQPLDAGRPVHRRHRARDPAPALLALLDQGDARPRPGQATTSPSPTC